MTLDETLTEVWQVKVGENDGKAARAMQAWEKFAAAVEVAGRVNGTGSGIQGPSLNLEEKRWIGVLGWESIEVSFAF